MKLCRERLLWVVGSWRLGMCSPKEEMARLRSFPQIGRVELIRHFTLTDADEAFSRKFRTGRNVHRHSEPGADDPGKGGWHRRVTIRFHEGLASGGTGGDPRQDRQSPHRPRRSRRGRTARSTTRACRSARPGLQPARHRAVRGPSGTAGRCGALDTDGASSADRKAYRVYADRLSSAGCAAPHDFRPPPGLLPCAAPAPHGVPVTSLTSLTSLIVVLRWKLRAGHDRDQAQQRIPGTAV